MIVDQYLRLAAVSRQAEVMLGVDEPAAIDVPLAAFLVCRTNQGQIDLADLVGRAIGGSTWPLGSSCVRSAILRPSLWRA